jgi:subtilase family serine protease
VYVDGQALVFGGTSAVAPLYAGLTALVQQSVGHRIAPLHQRLYQSPQAFHDIVTGDNGAYHAGPGWDACTGLGSPIGTAILEANAALPAAATKKAAARKTTTSRNRTTSRKTTKPQPGGATTKTTTRKASTRPRTTAS